MSNVDWSGIAQQMGLLRTIDGARAERGGTAIGYEAIVHILGKEIIASAVDHHLTYEPGWELARSVLMVLKPHSAAQRCLEIFRTAEDPEIQASAIRLLKDVSDRRVLDWMPEIISSTNPSVRCWAVGVIDQLLIMQNEIELDEAMPFIAKLLNDGNQSVREQAGQLMEMIQQEQS